MNLDQVRRHVQELTMEMRNRDDHGQFAIPSPMSVEDPKDPVDNPWSTDKDDDTSQVDNRLLHRQRAVSTGCREGGLLFQQRPVQDERSELRVRRVNFNSLLTASLSQRGCPGFSRSTGFLSG